VTAIEQQGRSSPHRANVTFEVAAVSPGGPKAQNNILAGLPTDFPASVLVVSRLCPDPPSLPAAILSRHTALMVKQTVDGDALRPATFFTPVPNRHLLVRPDETVALATRVQFVRPLCDISRALRTMAAAWGGW
jgi:two-component system chemotaxis response regulator CheB